MEVRAEPGPRPRLATQGAAGGRCRPRQAGAGGAGHDCGSCRTRPHSSVEQADEVGRGECGEQLRPGSGRSLDQGDLCGRGPDDAAISSQGARAVGRINKRTCSITVIAEDREDRNGTQSQSDRVPARHRHRLGIEVVRGAQLHRAAPRGSEDPRADHEGADRGRASRGSSSSARPTRSMSRCTPRSRASSSASRAPTSSGSASMLEKEVGKKVHLRIEEIKVPEIDAKLIAESIAEQIARRVAYRRAMKHAVQQAMRRGAKGVKIRLSWPPRRRRDEPHRSPKWTAACRCTRCARTSTTASSTRTRPMAASASRSGSTRAKSCRRVAR